MPLGTALGQIVGWRFWVVTAIGVIAGARPFFVLPSRKDETQTPLDHFSLRMSPRSSLRHVRPRPGLGHRGRVAGHTEAMVVISLMVTFAGGVTAQHGQKRDARCVLEAAGLVRSEKVGRVRTCAIEPEALSQAEQWINARRIEWEHRLDRLGDYLKTLETEGDGHDASE